MSTADPALDVAHGYHRAWTNKQFTEAERLLAPGVEIEVPINDYPTRESFAVALAAFGGLATHVELLSALGEGDEAMLLYDMNVEAWTTARRRAFHRGRRTHHPSAPDPRHRRPAQRWLRRELLTAIRLPR